MGRVKSPSRQPKILIKRGMNSDRKWGQKAVTWDSHHCDLGPPSRRGERGANELGRATRHRSRYVEASRVPTEHRTRVRARSLARGYARQRLATSLALHGPSRRLESIHPCLDIDHCFRKACRVPPPIKLLEWMAGALSARRIVWPISLHLHFIRSSWFGSLAVASEWPPYGSNMDEEEYENEVYRAFRHQCTGYFRPHWSFTPLLSWEQRRSMLRLTQYPSAIEKTSASAPWIDRANPNAQRHRTITLRPHRLLV